MVEGNVLRQELKQIIKMKYKTVELFIYIVSELTVSKALIQFDNFDLIESIPRKNIIMIFFIIKIYSSLIFILLFELFI